MKKLLKGICILFAAIFLNVLIISAETEGDDEAPPVYNIFISLVSILMVCFYFNVIFDLL